MAGLAPAIHGLVVSERLSVDARDIGERSVAAGIANHLCADKSRIAGFSPVSGFAGSQA
jgi:hypothetical protein